ncbi:monoglyceride lipase-like [Watersipora subatra]|uniref:monoglyceride lipase-like n=1 Tax=Watersipora subatra TaxID=2589382 RepID=UPI00355B52DA
MASEEEAISTFVNNRNQKLRRWCLPEATSPKALCVFVHGVGDHILAYKPVAQVLWEKHNIASCGFDQVGHGKSEGARVDIMDFQHYVDDLIQYIHMVKSENPHITIFAVGHSMGGLVLGHALLREADLVDGAVMYAAAIHANPEVFTPFKVTMAKMLSYVFPSFPVGGIGDEALTRNKEELERLRTDPLRRQGKLKARWGHHTINALVDFNSKMSQITVPVYIAHGGEDLVCHIDGSTKFRDTISSTDKTYKVYDKGYHRLHSEPDGLGEEFIEDMAQWMCSHIKSGQ